MVNVNFSKAKCPTCGKKVSLRVISKYFWHGTSYYTECNHCGQRIHPAKEPVSIFKCFSWGGMSVLLPMCIPTGIWLRGISCQLFYVPFLLYC